MRNLDQLSLKGKEGFFERVFSLEEHNTTLKKEIIGGITTFITMAYIIFVNPNILSATGMDKGALITATCLASFFGTAVSALWVNAPFAMAPGMGLNAFFTYTLVIGKGLTWQEALGVVFLSGVIFLVFAFLGIREKVVDAIPVSLRVAMSAGIGLFITFIGLQNLGLIVSNPATMIGLGNLNLSVVLGLFGLFLITILEIKNVKGSLLFGILITTILGMVFGLVELPKQLVSTPPTIKTIAFKMDILGAIKLSTMGTIFSLMFVDLFESIGTIMACAIEANMVDEKGKIRKIGRLLEADALATTVGAMLGTSTTTCYVEAASGIASGARTGMASLVTSILFLVALLFTPLIGVVPAFATAPALIVVGVYMFKNIKVIDFNDFEVAIPAFITIVMMPLSYSISIGLSFGFISYVIITSIAGDQKKIKGTMWVISLLSVISLLGH